MQRLAMLADHRGAQLDDFAQRLADDFQAPDQILREMLSLALAHFDQLAERIPQSRLDVGPGVVCRERMLGRPKHSRRAQDGLDADLAGRSDLFLEVEHGLVKSAREGDIERESLGGGRGAVVCDGHIQPAARDV